VWLPSRLDLGGAYNWLTYLFAEQVFWQTFRQPVNRWRREVLKLPPLPLTGPFGRLSWKQQPVLYGYSSHVLPRPPDWPDQVHVTGYWFLDHAQDWHPPQKLTDFLAAGPPPVYIGFGSIADRHPESLTELVLEALNRTGQRGILQAGWGGLGGKRLLDKVLQIEWVPHDWLFPQMAAVVHHGGAGTTATGLRAGIPSIIIPFAWDQPFWGRRVAEIGVGPSPIPRQKLSAERLAAAIQTATSDKVVQARAAAVGRQSRAEDGVAQAVAAFHSHLPGH
jgi:UDP:flavonoid glycosyltransferase YjiC (YdhE family)